MKKSLLIIAALFLVQLANAQKYPVRPTTKHGNYGHQQTHCHNSNNHYGHQSVNTFSCCAPTYGNPPRNPRGNSYGNRFMSDSELNAVLHAIRNESFSSDKLNVARQAVMYQNIKAYQVVEIGNLFSFESDRLEFAKMAFRNTVDKQNYYLVNSIFYFSSSKEELNNFIYR